MPRGLFLSAALGDEAQTKTLLGIPASATSVTLAVYLDVQLAAGYSYLHSPQADEYRGVLPLGEYVSRVSDLVVRGEGSPAGRVPRAALYRLDAGRHARRLADHRAGDGAGLLAHPGVPGLAHETQAQRFYGLSVSMTQGQSFPVVTPPSVDFSAQPPLDWREPGKQLRALAYGKLVPRHPDMPTGMGGTQCYGVTGGIENPSRRGELLCFEDSGPHAAYWNSEPDGPPLPYLSEGLYQVSHAGASLGYWGAAEVMRESRNLVVPSFRVSVGGLDYSSHVVDFQGDAVTLAGPASVFETLQASVQRSASPGSASRSSPAGPCAPRPGPTPTAGW